LTAAPYPRRASRPERIGAPHQAPISVGSNKQKVPPARMLDALMLTFVLVSFASARAYASLCEDLLNLAADEDVPP